MKTITLNDSQFAILVNLVNEEVLALRDRIEVAAERGDDDTANALVDEQLALIGLRHNALTIQAGKTA